MARSLWICPRRAGPAAERQGEGQDRQEGGAGGGKGNYGAGTSPASALAHVPCCHTKAEVAGIFGGTTTVQVTALGRSKAAYEFLVLHYFGLDSAKRWGALLSEVLPACSAPGCP